MLLTELEEDKPNFLVHVVKQLYENPATHIMVLVYTYDSETCLLSDRGYSVPLPEEDHMAFDFNLCANTFIRYAFGNIDKLSPKNTPKELIDKFKEMPKIVRVSKISNDMDVLAKYNKNVVYQCFNTVFNSQIKCFGL